MKEFIEKIYKELATIDDKQRRLKEQQRVQAMLQRYSGKDRIVFYDPEYLEKVKEERAGLEDIPRIMSKIPSLDKATKGFLPRELVVVSAPTGTGKTTFAQTLIENFYQSGVQTALFSYEVRPEDLPWSEGSNFMLPLSLEGDTMNWLERRMIEAKAKGADVIVIDHLHYISDVMNVPRGMNQSTVIGKVLSKLTQIAQKIDLLVILISHLTKTRFDEMPDMSDLRDSSFIAQYASVVIMLMRKLEEKEVDGELYEKAGNTTICSIQKCRGIDRTTDIFKLGFSNGKLYELQEYREI